MYLMVNEHIATWNEKVSKRLMACVPEAPCNPEGANTAKKSRNDIQLSNVIRTVTCFENAKFLTCSQIQSS